VLSVVTKSIGSLGAITLLCHTHTHTHTHNFIHQLLNGRYIIQTGAGAYVHRKVSKLLWR